MKLCNKIKLSLCLPLVLWIAGLGNTAIGQTTPEDLIAGTGVRIDQVFQAESGDPYSLAKVKASLDAGRPYYARAYSWSVVGYAARCFYLNESLAAANARLQQNARYYLRELTTADEAEILPTTAELNTSTYARIVDRDSLHWHADMVLRLIEMYGTNGTVAPGRMDPATEAKCLQPIWHYVRLVSRLEKAEYLNSKTWHLWESENHHVQCFSIAWHFSKIAKDLPTYQNQTHDDGSTPAQLYAAWNAYFVEYVRERFRKGIFVEMRSDGYNGESIRGVYNFFDFGDAAVKEHAGVYLDLFWAYWAQEQFNDVSGGGKARRPLPNTFTAGHGGIVSNMANLYFDIGVEPEVEGHSVNPLLSSYRPPPVVADVAVDVQGRGTYEVRQSAQGLGLAGQTNWNQSLDLDPYKLNTNGGGILRYTYCDPAFIMGTPMVEARPLSDWVAISSQNRAQGVIFSGAAEAARILPCVLPSDEREARNQFWSVQSKGSMITQMLSTHQGGTQMWAWISKAGLSDPVVEDGIVFVQSDEANGAYAAIRAVGTGYTLIEDRVFTTFTPPAHWVVQLNDKFKPLILEVMAKNQVAGFASFKAMVKANTPTFTNNIVTYTTIYGDVLTLDASYANDPTINGVPVDYTPAKSYDSPFLHGDYNGETFVIEKGSRQEVYHFGTPPSVANLSPADGSMDVAINSNLTVTFSENIAAGSGQLILKNLTDGTQGSINITDGTQVSITGSTLTINPTSDLLLGRAYAIQIPSGAIVDAFGDAFAGISNDTTWNFTTTATAPPKIVAVNDGNFGGSGAPASVTQSIAVGAGADMLIVMTSSELGGLTGAPMTVTYGGVAMNLAFGNLVNSGIWYLDLATPGISGTSVVVDMSGYTIRTGFSAGWVSIDGDLEAGESIVLHNTGASAAQSNTVSLTTSVETFNAVNFNGNATGGTLTVSSPNPTVIYTDNNIGSARAAAAHAIGVAPGSHTYQWTLSDSTPPHANYRRIDTASFAVVGNDFTGWIAGYPEMALQTALGDDPDGDGIPNGVEAWFGTHPAASSGGLANVATNGTTTTFTHPQSANPPADLSLFYLWSPNLTDWYHCDGLSGPNNGATAVSVISTNTLGTTKTVTLQSNGTMNRLFLRAAVAQNPSP
jgi:Bacterial Ig-like domain